MASSLFQLVYGYHPQDSRDTFLKDSIQTIQNGFKAVMVTSKHHRIPAWTRQIEDSFGRLLRKSIPGLG